MLTGKWDYDRMRQRRTALDGPKPAKYSYNPTMQNLTHIKDGYDRHCARVSSLCEPSHSDASD